MGVGDSNIKIIQEKVKANILVRGSEMYLDGNKNDLKIIESIVNQMMVSINNKGYLDQESLKINLETLMIDESILIDNQVSNMLIKVIKYEMNLLSNDN